MATAAHALVASCSAFAALGCMFLLAAAALVWRWPRTPGPGSQHVTSISVLKPLYGDEPGLLARLLSFCDQDYAGAVEFVFGVQDASDPAVAAVDAVRALRPDAVINLVIDRRVHGSNRKVSNLINIADRARHDILVIADSDIEVQPDYLVRIADALAPADVGAVTCLYHGEAAAGLGANLSALAITAHFLPGVVVGLAVGAARPCFGSTIALRRDTLDAIGGFARVADQLADDYAIGEAVRALGLRVAIPDYIVSHGCAEADVRSFFTHQLRCARTIRSLDPVGYLGSLITNPLPFAIVGAFAGELAAIAILCASIICRILVVWSVERRFGVRQRRQWLLPFADLAVFVVFCASFCGSAVTWRGHRFRVRADGTFSQSQT